MELPSPLRSAVDAMLEGERLEALSRAAETLSSRYRKEVRDGRLHIDGAIAAKAYLATRLPATFAAVRAAFDMVTEADPDFAPRTLLDFGAGPGTVLWAASDCWPDLERAQMIETSGAIRTVGEKLSGSSTVSTTWTDGDITRRMPEVEPAELVTLAYVLDELPETAIGEVTQRLWALASRTLVIIEPGTTAGWKRILAARQVLIEAGAHLLAPCPHAQTCPIESPDWCHFSRRVARSRIHRLAKKGEVPWEDEKYIFIAASRVAAAPPSARVLSPPRVNGGVGRIKLCRADGRAGEETFSRRDGEVFRQVRRADWGDGFAIDESG
ncbi:small ribosomal subunit Rsm22 family protein [Agrobacterium sp. ES01]|uniref:small ribosomal subunit Rsm22 family protein n=1 Tax=Agrobacterium sp. ES01 TaxID=3420714 RepID=UPI003D0A0AEE